MNTPLWATPERQAVLQFLKDNLFAGRCSYGHTNCPVMRKLQQAIIDRIGLPDEDNPFLWMMRAALVVTNLIKETPEPPPKKLPIVTHRDSEGNLVVFNGLSKAVKGGHIAPEPRPHPQHPQPSLFSKAEMYHFPTWFSSELIDYWKKDDRDKRAYLLRLAQEWMHSLPGIYNRGRYDSIAKSEAVAKRPTWEIVSYGVSVFTMERTAKVYIPGLKAHIWVDLTGIKAPSKSQKHKWERYGKGKEPQSIADQEYERISQAVKRFLETPDP